MPRFEAEWEPGPQEAGEIAATVAGVVGLERGRGCAFWQEAGRYERQDELDRLRTRGLIDLAQHQAGKRYQRQHEASYERGRYRSTLEYSRSEHAMGEYDLEHCAALAALHRDVLGGDISLVRACQRVCRGEALAPRDRLCLTRALSLLAAYYATEDEPESDELPPPSPKRSLERRAEEIVATWRGSRFTALHKDARTAYIGAIQLLHDAQSGRCAICGAAVEKGVASLDHAWPVGRGGEDEPGNITVSHRGCNERKGHEKPKRHQLAVLAEVNEILGWGEKAQSAEELLAERISEALWRLANPSPAVVAPKRWARPTPEGPAKEAPSHLEKASRRDEHMHAKWLAGQGVTRSNRTMRSRGVNG